VLETSVEGLPPASYVQDRFIPPPACLSMRLYVQVFYNIDEYYRRESYFIGQNILPTTQICSKL